MGRREQCTYRSNSRLGQHIYIFPQQEVVPFPPSFSYTHDTVWFMATPSITDPLSIARTSKEVLLCFFGVYGSVLDVNFECSGD